MGQQKEGELKKEDAKACDELRQRYGKWGRVIAPPIRVFQSEEEKKNRELRKYWQQYTDKGCY